MDTLIIENFRCFKDRKEIPIRPLTLLVGENSTGKTSFLAAVRAAYDLFRKVPNFNEEPFHLGSYAQIANYREDMAESFTIGQKFRTDQSYWRRYPLPNPTPSDTMKIEACFRSKDAQPTVASLSVSSGEYTLQLNLMDGHPYLDFTRSTETIFHKIIGHPWIEAIFPEDIWIIFHFSNSEIHEQENFIMSQYDRKSFDSIVNLLPSSLSIRPLSNGPRAYEFAPIRTNPRRTYDPTTEVRDPEGSHSPMMLARLVGNVDLEKYGEASGLYSGWGVRNFGELGSDPFQIEVMQQAGGRSRNLIDVGYGVSQALPIIADCVSVDRDSMLLIQQPEVHLHPRAQAAMGSFFVQLAASERNGLIVETHSDYLLDRIRIDVRDEKIKFNDVIILYFEQNGNDVSIFPIEIDALGNLMDVPEGYRSFFLQEQRRFLGVD